MSTKKENIPSNGWNAAIRDAKKRIESLKTVIATCEEQKAKGEIWPGSLPDSSRYNVTQSATHKQDTTDIWFVDKGVNCTPSSRPYNECIR